MRSMKIEDYKTQRLMKTANHKPVEKTSRCKAFAGMKSSSVNLIDFLQLEHLW